MRRYWSAKNLDGHELRALVFGDEDVAEAPESGETIAPADGPCVDQNSLPEV